MRIQRELRSCYSPWGFKPQFGTGWNGDPNREQGLVCTHKYHELQPKLWALGQLQEEGIDISFLEVFFVRWVMGQVKECLTRVILQ